MSVDFVPLKHTNEQYSLPLSSLYIPFGEACHMSSYIK